MTDKIPQLTPAQIDVVLDYLPWLEQPNFTPGDWGGGGYQLPYFSYDPKFDEFIDALYTQGVLFSFDWMRWQDEVQHYRTDPAALAQADLLTLRKLFTAHVRADRMIEGHLASLCEDGHLVAILRRLVQLREELS